MQDIHMPTVISTDVSRLSSNDGVQQYFSILATDPLLGTVCRAQEPARCHDLNFLHAGLVVTHATALPAHDLSKLWAVEHTEHTQYWLFAEQAAFRTCLQVLCQFGGL